MRFASMSAVALCCLGVACGGDKKDDGNSSGKICDAGKSVDCGDVPAKDVGGDTFTAGLKNATCASDGKSWDVSQCTSTKQGELAGCNTTDDCASGLECVDIESYTSICLKGCGTAKACATGNACVVTETNGDGFCLPIVGTGEVCYTDDNCAEADDSCLVVGGDANNFDFLTCSRDCEDVGTATGCGGGETCAPNFAFVECQGAKPDCTTTVACDITAANPCDAANGYRCLDIGVSDACARTPGFCIGRIIPLTDTLTALTAVSNQVQSQNFDGVCTLPYKPSDQTLNSNGQVVVDNAACGLTGVTGLPADVACLRVGLDFGICAAFCGTENGETLNCGSNYHCDRPTYAEALAVDYQTTTPNGATKVPCTVATEATACDTANGYICKDFAVAGTFNCLKPSQVCLLGSG